MTDNPEGTSMFTITREDLLDLLTTAATIGRNEAADRNTRGDIAELVEQRMRKNLDRLEETNR